VLWHYSGTTSYAYNDAVPPRVAEMPGENVGPGWRGRGRVHYSTDLPDCGIARWCIACSLYCLFGVSPRLCVASLAVKCGSNCRPTFGGSWGWLTARMCGVGLHVGTFYNRLHPSGGSNNISGAGGFATLKNTRIASGRRGTVRVQIWGGSAVFFTKDHSQRTTVSAAGVRVIVWVQP
jgi:hypothetical protein